jgi:hypothetical protein
MLLLVALYELQVVSWHEKCPSLSSDTETSASSSTELMLPSQAGQVAADSFVTLHGLLYQDDLVTR